VARIVKEAEYNAKRNEILDFTVTLVYSKGFAQMTIQDVLDGLRISRGAFYHYFDSKQALLEAVVERIGMTATEVFLPILHDQHLPAIQKFRRFFETSARWKNSEKTLIIDTLRTWYTEENMVVRQKIATKSIKFLTTILEPMIRQGIEEKVFTTRYPTQAAEIIAGVALSLSDTLVDPMISSQPDPSALQKIEIILDAYFDTIERILGAPAGSLKVLNAEDFKDWFVASQPEFESK
jgi:AcrR family transcriptional regulator